MYNDGVKVVIAPQTFKGSLSGMQAAKAIGEGVLSVFSDAELHLVPVADGGDGTVDALVEASKGRFFTSQVIGPLGNPIEAVWGVMGDQETAVIEMATASGLVLVPTSRRDPRITTTYGTGQLLREAIDKGYRKFIVGIGGSATNDGGAGVAQALGVRLLDKDGRQLGYGGSPLAYLAKIDMSDFYPSAPELSITIATDVNNPLCGPKGASAIYGPQKGATPEIVKELDRALANYANVIKNDLGLDVVDVPGAGAAGGLGAGLMAFLNARIHSGVDLVCDALNIDEHLKNADLVITGEGEVDSSTIFNKAPIGVARRAKKVKAAVIVVAGSLGEGYQEVYKHGVDAVVSVQDHPMAMEESLVRAEELLRNASERAMRLVNIGELGSW